MRAFNARIANIDAGGRRRERGYLIKLNLHTRGTLARVPQASSLEPVQPRCEIIFNSRDFNLRSATVTNITRYLRRMFSPQLVKLSRRFVISIFVNELPFVRTRLHLSSHGRRQLTRKRVRIKIDKEKMQTMACFLSFSKVQSYTFVLHITKILKKKNRKTNISLFKFHPF